MDHRHRIDSATFDLRLDRGLDAARMEGEFSRVVQAELLPVVEQVLDEFGAGAEPIRIDSLEVDLGNLVFDGSWVRVRERVGRELRAALARAHSRGAAAPRGADVAPGTTRRMMPTHPAPQPPRDTAQHATRVTGEAARTRAEALHAALLARLLGRAAAAGDGLDALDVEALVAALLAEAPSQLRRLYRELRGATLPLATVSASLPADALRALVRGFLSLAAPGETAGPPQFVRAIEEFAARADSARRYYGVVLARLVNDELVDLETIATGRAAGREVPGAPPPAAGEQLIRGYALYEALRGHLLGRPSPAVAGVEALGVEALVTALLAEQPQQLQRLYRELQSATLPVAAVLRRLPGDALRALVHGFLSLGASGEAADAPSQFVSAIEAFATRAVSPRRYYGEVLGRLVRDELVDLEAIAAGGVAELPARGAAAVPAGEGEDAVSPGAADVKRVAASPGAAGMEEDSASPGTADGERDAVSLGAAGMEEDAASPGAAGMEEDVVSPGAAGMEEDAVSPGAADGERDAAPPAEAAAADDAATAPGEGLAAYLREGAPAPGGRVAVLVQGVQWMLSHEPARLRRLLEEALADEASVGRLVGLLPEPVLARVLFVLAPPAYQALQGAADTLAIAAHAPGSGLPGSRVSGLKWRFVIGYLLHGEAGAVREVFDEAAFVRAFGAELARHSSVGDVKALRAVLARQLALNVLPVAREAQLRVLQALRAEATERPARDDQAIAAGRAAGREVPGAPPPAAGEQLIRGYALYEALRGHLLGRPSPAVAGVEALGVEALVTALLAEQPQQLQRLYRELQSATLPVAAVLRRLPGDALRALVHGFLSLGASGEAADAPSQFVSAIEAFATRAVSPRRYYGEVLGRLVRDELVDLEAIAAGGVAELPARGAAAVPAGEGEDAVSPGAADVKRVAASPGAAGMEEDSASPGTADGERDAVSLGAAGMEEDAASPGAAGMEEDVVSPGAAGMEEDAVSPGAADGERDAAPPAEAAAADDAATAPGEGLAAYLREGAPAPGGRVAVLVQGVQWMLSHEPARLRRLLEEALADEASVGRLVGLLPEPVLARVLFVLAPPAYQALQGAADTLAIAAHAPGSGLPGSRVSGLKWRFVIGYLLHGEAGAVREVFDEAAFVRAFGAELARHSSVGDVKVLRAVLARQLALNVLPVAREAQLRVLQALRAEAVALEPSAAAPALAPQARDDAAEVRPDAAAEGFRVDNAGLVLAASYLPLLFKRLGLTETGAFRSRDAAERAARLLQYMVDGATEPPQRPLVLNRVLCGLSVTSQPRLAEVRLTAEETEAVEGLMEAMIAHWSALGNTTVTGLRESFLQREGTLVGAEDAWRLSVVPRAYDMLLDRLPWSFSTIRHPWMERVLLVSWR